MKRSLLALMLGSAMLLSACAPAQAPSEPAADEAPAEETAQEEVVKIGYIGPLTGDAASFGKDETDVIKMYLQNNPEWDGKQVEVVYEDGQCSGQQAASAAQKLINTDGVKIILGGGCSGETLGAAPVTERNKVLLISSLSTSPEVTDAGDYVFRVSPSDESSTDVMTEILTEKYSKIAMISQNNDFAQAYRSKLMDKLPAAGAEVVVDETFNSGTTDFKTLLQKVKDSEADVLINLAGEIAPGGFINKQARELGIELPIFGTDGLMGTEFFDVAKDATEETTIVVAAADKSRADVAAYLEAFQDTYDREPTAEVYALLNRDRLNILKAAVEQVGWEPDAIRDYLYDMPVFKGLGGDIEFDENGDSSIRPSVMWVQDGKFVLKK